MSDERARKPAREGAKTGKKRARSHSSKPPAKSPLRVIGMDRVDDGVELVVSRGWGLLDAATNPCAHCPAKCCGYQIALTTVEVLRMAFTLRLHPSRFVEAVPVTTGGAERFAHALLLDDGPSKLVLSRPNGWCTHLVRPGSDDARCGVYALRPAVCRLFPFLFELDGETHSVGHGNPICPVRFAVNSETEARLLPDARQWQADFAEDARVASRWNDTPRSARSLDALLLWLTVDEAPAHGHDPRALDRFPPRPKFAFLKAATRRVI